MRVIAGSARGRLLKGPKGRAAGTRPTSDLVRGAIFSALASMDANLVSVLDLYAGTGALGIEALSRGALHCDFVERDAAACAAIKENLRLTGFEGRARVLCRPVERARELLDGPYTLIIADPPYDDDAALALLDSLAATALLADNAVLVLEQAARREAREALGKLSLASVRRHGDTAVAIYRRGR